VLKENYVVMLRMNQIKKVEKVSMSGGNIIIPLKITAVLALKNGMNVKSIPDELLQTVNSIKVKMNPDEWKSVSRSVPYSWRNGAKPSVTSHQHQVQHQAQQQQQQQPSAPPYHLKKYVSKFKNCENDKVEDKILNTIINGKLNKFSPSNYDEIKQFLEQILDSGETDFIKDFMLLVFKKAAAEEIYCPHYARLMSELIKSYESLSNEMISLQGSFMQIFEEVDESDTKDYSSFLERNQQKIYRLGYSQFLAELAHREVLNSDMLMNTLIMLINQIKTHSKDDDKSKLIEEYCDCILRMTKIFRKNEGEYLTQLKVIINDKITPLIKDVIKYSSSDMPSISKKSKFALMDVIDNLQPA
jgi:hypothetical protein